MNGHNLACMSKRHLFAAGLPDETCVYDMRHVATSLRGWDSPLPAHPLANGRERTGPPRGSPGPVDRLDRVAQRCYIA